YDRSPACRRRFGGRPQDVDVAGLGAPPFDGDRRPRHRAPGTGPADRGADAGHRRGSGPGSGVRPPSRPLWNARLKGRRLNSAAGSPLYTASDKRAMRIPEPVAVTGPRPCVRRRALGIGSGVDHCCEAWNKLVDQPWTFMSIGLRPWALGWSPMD